LPMTVTKQKELLELFAKFDECGKSKVHYTHKENL